MNNHWPDNSEYPFEPNYFGVNGEKLHYIDEGQGEIILYVHGTPSWSFDFRNVIKALRTDFRCVAVDHIGFGLSSKPEHYDYSTQNHSKTLGKFILEKQLDNITLAVHDFGGPVGLNFAIQHPEKISKIIIFNSWLWSSNNDPDFKRLSRILKNPLLPFLYRCLNFSPRFILPESFGDHKLPNHILEQYTRPFRNKTQRNGVLAFARSLLNDQDWFETLWNQRHAVSGKPALFIWGDKDPFIKPHYLEKFISGFNNAKAVRLETCGHFPQEEQPETVAKLISDFMNERQKE